VVNIGILALQGDVREHAAAFAELGQRTQPVRCPADLDGLDGLVLPGGESTTLSMLLASSGLFEAVADALAGGLPVFGTCAGLVLLASEVLDGRSDQRSFGVLDCTVRRNGFGPQLQSFEGMLDAISLSVALATPDAPLPSVFIRAPEVVRVGDGVEVLAWLPVGGGRRVAALVRHGQVMGSVFHPELTDDRRVHRLFVKMVDAATSDLDPDERRGALH
jgi:pyridoxal 5'-phosphate synthase pdxT subunit